MIIDEGFLSNAKKISETQPQQSEVKIPEIRRENYEYHVKITYKLISGEEDTKLRSRILRCEIFKEYRNVDMTDDESGSCIKFDCDMFITEDSVYGLLYCIYSSGLHITPFIIITGLNDIKASLRNYDYFIYPGTAMLNKKVSNMLYQIINIFGKFGISPKNIVRWMYRNSIMDIVSKSTVYGTGFNGVFPVYVKSFDDISEILESSIEQSPYTYDMMDNGQSSNYHTQDDIIEMLRKYGPHEYFVYYEESVICIQPAYPFPFDGTYVYAKFFVKLDETYSIRMNRSFIYMTEFMNDCKDKSFSIESSKDISETDFIEFSEYKKRKKDEFRLRYLIIIKYIYKSEKKQDTTNIEKNVLSSSMIKKHENESSEYTKDMDKQDIQTLSFDAEIDMTIDNAYDFIHNTQGSIKNIQSINVLIFDRKLENSRTLNLLGTDIIKRAVNDFRMYNFERALINFGFSLDEITEWETKNKIINISGEPGRNVAVHIESFRGMEIFMRTIKEGYTKEGYGHKDKKNPYTMFEFLKSHDVKEYIMNFRYQDIMNHENLVMTLRSMYPYKINGKYAYIYLATYWSEHDDSGQYTYIKDISEKIKRMEMEYGMNVSDIKLCRIDSKGNIEQ